MGGGPNLKGIKAQTESLQLHMGRGAPPFYNVKPAWGQDLARATPTTWDPLPPSHHTCLHLSTVVGGVGYSLQIFIML